MIKAIIFDFDGTVADTAPGIIKTMQHTFQEMGLPEVSETEMRATIGLRLDLSLQQAGHLSEAEAATAAATYRRLFSLYETNYITLFPSMRETLMALHQQGIRLAICTSREALSLDSICARHGIKALFETRTTNSDHLAPKPAPDMVLTLLQRMHLKQEEVLVVGDTTFDILMGNRAGCATVAVTWGNHSRQQLLSAHPTYLIDHISHLPPLLNL